MSEHGKQRNRKEHLAHITHKGGVDVIAFTLGLTL